MISERIIIDILEIPTKNYVLTFLDESTKFTQVYYIEDKTVQTVINQSRMFFQY